MLIGHYINVAEPIDVYGRISDDVAYMHPMRSCVTFELYSHNEYDFGDVKARLCDLIPVETPERKFITAPVLHRYVKNVSRVLHHLFAQQFLRHA